MNTGLRTKAQHDFGQEFFKQMNNSEFSKTIENMENRAKIKLVTDKQQAFKLVAQINNDRCMILEERLASIYTKKTQLAYKQTYSCRHVYTGLKQDFDIRLSL